MRESADREDSRTFAEADLAFHSLFYELSGHRRLLAVWRQLQPTFTALLEVTTAHDRDLHPSAESHIEILRGVRVGDVEAAVAEVSRHIIGARDRMIREHKKFSTNDESP